MITSKELQYVDANIGKIPMPGEDYSRNVLEHIKDCYEDFKVKYNNKDYNFIFSNGDEILFKILPQNMAHMLGIDVKSLKSEYFEPVRKNIFKTEASDFSAVEALELVIEHREEIVKNDNDINCKPKILNYYKSQIKCEIFDKFSNFNKFNFGYLHQPDYIDPSSNDSKETKLFYIPSNEPVSKYFMMLITPNKGNSFSGYVVISLMAPPSDSIVKFFENNEAAIPTQILLSDNNNFTKLEATANEKIQLLTMYKNIINEYKLSDMMNVTQDYEAVLNEQCRTKLLKK